MDTSPNTPKPPEPKKPQRRNQRLTAPLNRDQRVMTEGVDSTMEAYLSAIGDLFRRALAARKQGIELPTFLNILRDQAAR